MAAKTKPSIDPAHAKKIFDAEISIRRSEKRLEDATEAKKAAKKDFDAKVRRLRKLASEVTDKGLWTKASAVKLSNV